MQICFPISKKSIVVFLTIIVFLFSIAILTPIFIIKKHTDNSISYDDFCLDNYSITKLIDKEQNAKEIIERYKDKKVIALTFDDGPSKYTEKLLNILKEKDVKCSFFVLGYKAENRIDTIKRIYNEGHNIGLHGYTHKLFTKLDETQINDEIECSRDLIENIIQTKVEFIRIPYGSSNELIESVISEHDLTSVLWNIDSKDWRLRNRKKIEKRIIKNAKDGKIILMHDTYGFSVNAVSNIIDELKKDEFCFVTMHELLILQNAK